MVCSFCDRRQAGALDDSAAACLTDLGPVPLLVKATARVRFDHLRDEKCFLIHGADIPSWIPRRDSLLPPSIGKKKPGTKPG